MKPIPLIYPPREVFLSPDDVFKDFENNELARNKLSYEDIYKRVRVTLPKEGGIIVYFAGQPHPYKGFPFPAVCNNLGAFKRCVIVLLRLLKKNPLVLTSLVFKKNRDNLIEEFEHLGFGLLHKYFLKPERYCRCVREIYRLCYIAQEFLPQLTGRMINVICMLPENDNAYRFRIQILSQMTNKQELIKNSKRVIIGLLNFAIESEKDKRLKETWKALKMGFGLAWLLPKFRRLIRMLAKEVRLYEILPDEADKHYYSLDKSK